MPRIKIAFPYLSTPFLAPSLILPYPARSWAISPFWLALRDLLFPSRETPTINSTLRLHVLLSFIFICLGCGAVTVSLGGALPFVPAVQGFERAAEQ